MSNPTSNYSWQMPTSTDLVKDLPADFETFGQAVDTTVAANASAAINKTIVDAKGDLIAGTAADTVARLAVGTNGQVLTADSAEATGMKWATSASGGMTLLSTTTLSGSSVTINSINSGYTDLYVRVVGAQNSSGNAWLVAYFNGATSYSWTSVRNNDGTNGVGAGYSDGSNFGVLARVSNTTATEGKGYIDLKLPNYSGSYIKNYSVNGQGQDASTAIYGIWTQGSSNSTAAINSVTLALSSGNFSSGTALIYGVK